MSAQVRASVLVVEDDVELQGLVADCLESTGITVSRASDAAQAIENLRGFAYDGIVIDLRLPDGSGMDVLDVALTRFPDIRAIVMTGCGAVPEAVAAIKRGAIDFLVKPFELARLVDILRQSLEQPSSLAQNGNRRPRLRSHLQFKDIVGESAAMQSVFATLERVSTLNSTILVEGETGTGKELIARTIHQNSLRRNQPFVAFNAAAIPEGLAEAELFGHVRGAFTGATQNRIGRFELANRGSLFIDEVSSMSLSLQAKLLRALQERQMERVGESRTVSFDVRVIAAANVNLRKMVNDGTFREDLYYRLSVIPVRLPPLRERPEDVPLLVQHCLEKVCEANRLPPRTIGQEPLRLLMEYSWPGNVRQLENVVEYAVAMSGSETEIVCSMFPDELQHPTDSRALSAPAIPEGGLNLVSVVSQLERDIILQCLEKTGGNKRQAARLLQLSRTTLIDKLNRMAVKHPAA
jgi:DNA-binding NtrC family response regulator